MPIAEAAFIGEIATYGFAYAPRGWTHCNGSFVQVQQNQAMFALIGTLYGGDGRVTFQLPNLNSRMPVGAVLSGIAPGLTHYSLGDQPGHETRVLSQSSLPTHSHLATFSSASPPSYAVDIDSYDSGADKQQPDTGDLLAAGTDLRFRSPGGFAEPLKVQIDSLTAFGDDLLAATVDLDHVGGGRAFQMRSPVAAVNFCICEDGVFPPRS